MTKIASCDELESNDWKEEKLLKILDSVDNADAFLYNFLSVENRNNVFSWFESDFLKHAFTIHLSSAPHLFLSF